MRYLGGKSRIAKTLAEIMTKERRSRQVFVDVFAGAMNVICAMHGPRIANDINPYLTAVFKAVQNGWEPPEYLSREAYQAVRNNRDKFPSCLVGFVGFGCSFGGKWFAGYASDSKGTSYATTTRRSLLKQRESLADVEIHTGSYLDLELPQNSLVYCDPPYAGTTGYSYCGGFDHDAFWAWVKKTAGEGHTVFVSEYAAPEWATCVWERTQTTTACYEKSKYKQATERLFKI